MTIHPEPDPVFVPYRDGPPLVSTSIDLPGTRARIFQSYWMVGSMVTDFVLVQQVDVGDDDDPEWVDIVRVDCCHQEVHVHRLYADPDQVYKVIRPIATSDDLQKGADEAEDIVFDDWETNLRRWESGR